MEPQSSTFEHPEDQKYFEELFADDASAFEAYLHFFDFRPANEKRSEFNKKRKKLFNTLAEKYGKECLLKYPGLCSGSKRLEVDHLIPLATNKLNKIRNAPALQGKKVIAQSFGSNHPDNLIIACEKCNGHKKHRLPLREKLLEIFEIKRHKDLQRSEEMKVLERVKATLKTGEEQLVFHEKPLPFTLLDFWKWSASDLMSNATRGIFAEYIVATATGIDVRHVRDEWGTYDLETPEGIKLEVKSSAYLQTWAQKSLSKIIFGIKAPRQFWDPITHETSYEVKRHADVYVFCLMHHQTKHNANPLDLNHWEFYVVSTRRLNEYTKSKMMISLKALQLLAQPVGYDQLHDEIRNKHKASTQTNVEMEIDSEEQK